MKIQYAALFLGLCPVSAIAQGPTLDNANNTPVVGTSFTVHRNTAFVDPGAAGVGQIWDHEGLVSIEQVEYEILDVDAYINSAQYPQGTHLITDGNDTLIYKIDAAGWEVIGEDVTFILPFVPPTDVHAAYTDGIMQLQYPASFGTNWADPVLASYELEDFGTITRTGISQSTVDGHGMIMLPSGDQDDILRVYSHLNTNEAGTGASGTRNVHMFSFHAQWLKFPLARFVSDTITLSTPFLFENVVGRVEWLDEVSVGVIESIEQNEAFGLWPTPARDVLNITLPVKAGGKVQGVLRDLTGRTVREWSLAPIGNTSVDINGLPAGQYFLQVIDGMNEIGVRKVIVH